ncbi:lamin tail domain-containing protein [Natrialbaceae archaeon A-CW2]
MKRAILVICVALMIVLAGCSGGTDNVGDDALETDGNDEEATDEGDDTDDTDDSGGADENETGDTDVAIGDALSVAALQVEGVSADEEYIVIENTGDQDIDLSGYELRDRDGGQIDGGLSAFVFPSGFVLEAGATVTVWTGTGEDTDSDRYWGYGVNIWSGSGDVVTLTSPDGEVVFEYGYGEFEGDGETGEGDEESDDSDEVDETDGGDAEPIDVDGELEIHHLDVGQADSTLIITPEGETILIDTGDWRQDGSEVIASLEDLGIDRIDHLVATHAHADHVGGHAGVIEHFETHGEGIGAAYDSGVPATSNTYENYLDAVDEYDVDLFIVEEGEELPIDGDLTATVVNPPDGDSGSDLHYNSVSIVFEFGDFRYLTTGDAETAAEQRLVDAWANQIDADVYHAGHHGSATSSTEPFMDAVDPEIAIISSAYDSQYGHPADEVLERFAAHNIDTYWTAVHGDILVSTDGTTIEVATAESFSNDAQDILEEKPSEDDGETSSITTSPVIHTVQAPAFG